MSRAPSPLNSNRFSVLETSEQEIDEAAQKTPNPIPTPAENPKSRRPKWEKRVRQKLVIRSLEMDSKCIMLPIHMKTTDTIEEASMEAMVDSGTTGDFIDRDFVTKTSTKS